jgi:hypothetical protein
LISITNPPIFRIGLSLPKGEAWQPHPLFFSQGGDEGYEAYKSQGGVKDSFKYEFQDQSNNFHWALSSLIGIYISYHFVRNMPTKS